MRDEKTGVQVLDQTACVDQTKTADQILDTIAHCQRINDTGH